MRIETLSRHFREAYRGVRRNAWMSFAAISAVAVTLFIFGIFLIFAFNVRYMAVELDKQVAIRAALAEQLTDDQQLQVLKQIESMPEVKSAELVPKEEGLRQLKAQWGEEGTEIFRSYEGEGKNPLPDVITVVPKDPHQIKSLTDKVKSVTGN